MCASIYRQCFFFFSSRRRHTRCSRDWSSDVCSSDLPCRLSPCPLALADANSSAESPWCCDQRSPSSTRSEEHTSELQSRLHLVCRLLLEKKKRTSAPAIAVPIRHLDWRRTEMPSVLS